jgi:hypothetical protein
MENKRKKPQMNRINAEKNSKKSLICVYRCSSVVKNTDSIYSVNSFNGLMKFGI